MVLSEGANFDFQYDCSIPYSFRDMTLFLIFSEIFKKNLDVKKVQNFEDINPVIGICEGTFRGLRIWPLNMIVQTLVVFEI